MKFFSLVLENGKKIGYRVVTNKGNQYDIRLESMPLDLPIIGNISGRVICYDSDSVFSTDNDIALELSEGDFRIRLLYELYSDRKSEPCQILYGDDLRKVIDAYDVLHRRRYVKGLVNALVNDVTYDLYELYGMRRTGKTVSMFHIMKGLLGEGVSLDDICYISLRSNNCIDSEGLEDIISFFMDDECVKYIFVDEITYIKDNFNFLVSFGNGFESSKIVVSGTNSSVFLVPNSGELYDRAYICRTSKIPFWEYCHIYPGSTVMDYIREGELLRKSSGYKHAFEEDIDMISKGIDEEAVDYMSSSIYENILNGLSRYSDFSSRYEILYKVYDEGGKNVIKTAIYKMAQKYSSDIVARVIEEEFKSSDIGNMLDFFKKDSLVPNEEGNPDEDMIILGKRTKYMSRILSEILNRELSVEELNMSLTHNDYMQLLRELKSYLSRIDCFYTDRYIKETSDREMPEVNVNADYFVPMLIRYGLACRLVKALNWNWSEFCMTLSREVPSINKNLLYNSLDTFIYDALSGVEGLLCEEVIRSNLNDINSGCVRKFRHDDTGMEIDLLYQNDMIEVKRSDKAYPYHARWLVNSYFIEDKRYVNRRRVLLTNDEKERVERWSEREVLESLQKNNIRRGQKENARIRERLESNDSYLDIKQDIYCLNMSKYLLESCRYELDRRNVKR